VLHTRLCDLFGIEHPILNAPMGGGMSSAGLAAGVSEAGGLGMIGGTSMGGASWLRDEIKRAQDLTDRPFGVGFISHFPGAAQLMDVATEAGVRIVAHSFADPAPFMAAAHDAGATVLCQVRTVADARHAADCGVDVIVAQGTEAGGHTGDVCSTLPLVPAVLDAVGPTPVIAAGGIADGRGIAAALMLGADGVWMGTRFVASPEAGSSEAYRAHIIEAGADSTVLTDTFDIATGLPWPAGVGGRAIRNAFTDRWHGRDDELRAAIALGEGPIASDDPDEQARWAGPASAFVDHVEPAGDIVRRLVAETESVLRDRARAVLD
jgi:nitronate monooxygenase